MINSPKNQLAFRIQRAVKNYGPTRALCIKLPGDQPIEIYRGATTAILGLSGSGKSTLLSLLGLLEMGDAESTIEYFPVDGVNGPLTYSTLSKKQKVKLRNHEFGVAFQDGHLIGHITANDNIKLPMSLAGAGTGESNRISRSLAKSLKIGHRKSSRPKELSGGEYQRVAIARAMSHNPNVIFADEPTGNLDTDTGAIVMDMLHAWRQKAETNTLVLVTHDIQQAYNYADHFIILNNGSLKCCVSKNQLQTPQSKVFCDKYNVKKEAVETDVLFQLLKISNEKTGEINYPSWDKKTSLGRRSLYQLWYGLRDLFPIRVSPFDLTVFKTTLRDTVFTILTILSVTMLVAVLLSGYGIFHGVNRFQKDAQKSDIRANRLIVEIEATSSTSDISDELIKSLRKELKDIPVKPSLLKRSINILPWRKDESLSNPAVKGVYGFSRSQLFIFKDERSETMVGATGTTVDPDSPLLDRLTYRNRKLNRNIIESYNTEGIIAKENWIKRTLKIEDDQLPAKIMINYGDDNGSGSREELPLLGVVDNLPDGVFLIASGCWHKIRDRLWKPNYRMAEITAPLEAKVYELREKIEYGVKIFNKNALVTNKQVNGKQKIFIYCGNDNGWKSHYWNNIIYKVKIKPLLDDAGITGKNAFKLTGSAAGAQPLFSSLAYSNAAVYLEDIGAVEEVAQTIRNHEAGLGVDRYVEDAYKWIHQTSQLSALILSVIALCAFFLSAVNIFLMFYQTILRKRHEIGILKAFGCSGLRISNIFFIESFYIAMASCGFGLLISIYVGNWAGNALIGIYELNGNNAELFYLDCRVVSGILLFVLGLCEIITYLATFKTAKKSSNELLRQRD